MMYVDFMKNFLLADSSEQMAVRLEMSVIAISSLEPAEKKSFDGLDVHHV